MVENQAGQGDGGDEEERREGPSKAAGNREQLGVCGHLEAERSAERRMPRHS